MCSLACNISSLYLSFLSSVLYQKKGREKFKMNIFTSSSCSNLCKELYQVWSILPALELHPLNWFCGVTSRGAATSMQTKWIKLDLPRHTSKDPVKIPIYAFVWLNVPENYKQEFCHNDEIKPVLFKSSKRKTFSNSLRLVFIANAVFSYVACT